MPSSRTNPSSRLCFRFDNLSSRYLSVEAAGASVEKRRLGNLLAHDVALEKVRQPHLGLVLEVHRCRDGEDLVDLFERELLRLAHEAEDHAPCNEIESGVEADCIVVSMWSVSEKRGAVTYKLR